MKRRSPAIENAIVEGISRGITLKELCRDLKIGYTTVWGWMEDEAFAARMARARAMGFDALVDEMIEIADDARNDWMDRKDAKADTPPVRNPENVARSRLRIETRMRVLARWYPLRFGGMAGRIGGMGGLATIGAAANAGSPSRIQGAGTAPMDATAIAARLSSILSTIAARDPAGDGLEDGDDFSGDARGGDPGEADGEDWGDGPVIEHDDMGTEGAA